MPKLTSNRKIFGIIRRGSCILGGVEKKTKPEDIAPTVRARAWSPEMDFRFYNKQSSDNQRKGEKL